MKLNPGIKNTMGGVEGHTLDVNIRSHRRISTDPTAGSHLASVDKQVLKPCPITNCTDIILRR